MPLDSGLLVVISAPSGGGKTTVVDRLVGRLPDAVRLVTTTSRTPRPNESPDVDYHFLSRREFAEKIEAGEMVEHVEYAGHYYGIERSRLEALLAGHRYVLAPIDVRGRANIAAAGVPHLSIFLLPESLAVLRERLERRPNAVPEEINERLAIAEREIALAREFDRQIFNREGCLEETLSAVQKAVEELAMS
ncbi:MAG: Guanylate kinase [Candidatus Magasanikbacteria bacterium GW2011_GWA2_56_11]|uniref:Guanylate kinase n=1 Tax=Candidatus Magasanikbacteria bacterium GW2011_GWA2_56_11 TaxID=1619044 RepID=A0A0G2AMR9_9BACT|nr:MAG: Guanylate kinase [Candidatus Magasanikbacteria bacterium GW2011_GWA2_56_11]